MIDIWEETRESIKKNLIPLSIVWELTRRCNLNCIHCYNLKDEANLSFSEIRKIAFNLREAGTLILTLTGGEIFIREDILDVLFFLKGLGFDLKIITNATLIDNFLAERLKEIYPSEIGISLYGASSLVHEKITRGAGSFDKTLEAVKVLKEKGLAVHIKCTLMRENFKEYPKIIELANKLGVNYIIDPIISPKDNGSLEVLSHRLSRKELRSFYWKEFDKIEDFDNSQICDAGFNFGAISAEGFGYPCIQLPLKVGEATKESFKDIWYNSESLKEFREKFTKEPNQCRNCSLYSYCSRCPGLSFLEKKDPFSSYSMACLIAKIYKEYKENYGVRLQK